MNTETMNNPTATPKRTSTGAMVLFVLAALGISGLILIGHVVAWNLEQTAIADESYAVLGNAGKVWFPVQALLVAILCGIGVAVSKSVFRPMYRKWLIATLITLPAFALRLLGPNQDQVGAAIQIVIALAGAAGVLLFNRKNVRFNGRALFALTIVPLGIWPFLLWGALGSGTDILLNLLAGLALGLLAASLAVITDSNYFLNGLAIGTLLAILGSALGYDGSQLLLLIVLPAFGFALTYVAESLLATTLAVGLLAAAPLIFIDPTELTIVLGDLLPWALKASFLMMGLGLLIGFAAWIALRGRMRGAGSGGGASGFPVLAPVVAWGLALVLYGFFGLHGFSGDRLFVSPQRSGRSLTGDNHFRP